jgi:hypothetical protein
MNTIDATPHISVGDVSPCSVRATRSLNWHSVQIPRTALLLRVNPRTSTEKLSGLKEMEPICAVIAPAQQRDNPCNATQRPLHFSSARQRCVHRNPLCFSPRARRGSSWSDRPCDMAWRARVRRRQDRARHHHVSQQQIDLLAGIDDHHTLHGFDSRGYIDITDPGGLKATACGRQRASSSAAAEHFALRLRARTRRAS